MRLGAERSGKLSMEFSEQQIIPCLRRFVRLQRAGVSSKQTLEVLVLYERPPLKQRLIDMMDHLEQGAPLVAAFEPLITDQSLYRLLVLADREGRVLHGLEQVIQVMEMKAHFKRELSQLLRYPFVIIGLLGVLGGIYSFYILPKMLGMMPDASFPWYVELFLSRSFLPIFLSCASIAGYVAYRLVWKSGRVRVAWLVRLKRTYTTFLFVSELSLLKDGYSSVRQLFAQLADDEGIVAEIAARIHRRLMRGERLEEVLVAEEMIDSEVISLITVSAWSGELGVLMQVHRELLLDVYKGQLKQLLTKIEPFLYGLISVLVILIFYMIYLPVQLMLSTL